MKRFKPALQEQAGGKIAVAVSGGPDSMALCGLLREWNCNLENPYEIHALSVDHGLRPESADEALMVYSTLKDWPHFRHKTLKWEHDHGKTPDSRVQEQARQVRYDLLEKYCTENGIIFLCVAHHSEDQAETVLFRLCKGSGIDGLGAMRPFQQRGHIILCRPLLDYTKADLIEFCKAHNLSYCHDPSNDKEVYARIRLRQSLPVLEKEGLSIKRLNVMSKRMQRASSALDYYAVKSTVECVMHKDTSRIEIKYGVLKSYPEEIIFRVLKALLQEFNQHNDYGVRTERIENVVYDIIHSSSFRTRTLGGIKFSLNKGILQMSRE